MSHILRERLSAPRRSHKVIEGSHCAEKIFFAGRDNIGRMEGVIEGEEIGHHARKECGLLLRDVLVLSWVTGEVGKAAAGGSVLVASGVV